MLRLGSSSAFFKPFEPQKHISLFAGAGIRFLELAGNLAPLLSKPDWFRNVGAIAAQCGVRINSIHVPFYEGEDLSSANADVAAMTVDRALDCLHIAEELGAQCIVLHPSAEPISESERPSRLRSAQNGLERLLLGIPVGSKVRVAIEGLPRTCLCNTVFEHLKFVDPFPPDRVGVCLDTNHTNLGQDLLWATRTYAARIFTLHISDNDGSNERHWVPGDGVIPWKKWAETLRETGYNGPLVHEFIPWFGDRQFDAETELNRMVSRARELFS